MAWYDTGTVNVTNGSVTVTGVGTNFIAGAQVGEGFYGSDDSLYEIQAIVSATSLTLADPYLGATQTGQTYKIVPTQSLVASLATQVSTLIADFQGVVDEAGEGKFNTGTAVSPGVTFTLDQDTGIFRPLANQLGFTTAGVQRALLTSTGLNSTVIGATTPAAGTFTDLSATIGIGVNGTTPVYFLNETDTTTYARTLMAAGLLRIEAGASGAGASGAGNIAIQGYGGVQYNSLLLKGNTDVQGTFDVTGLSTLPTVDINGGTIDGTSIGNTVTANGSFAVTTATRFRGPLGAAATPIYSFTDDDDTGMYRNGVNGIGFTTGGALAASIFTTGFNGAIGGTTPAAGTFTGVYLGGTGAANHLTDYEEGTWTPVITDLTNNATSSIAVGTYTKVGNSVHVQGRIVLSSLGSVTGNVYLSGLPFSSKNLSNNFGAMAVGRAAGLNLTAGVAMAGHIQSNASYAFLTIWDATVGTTTVQATEFTATGDISFSMDYISA
jgi:hypothetical protein